LPRGGHSAVRCKMIPHTPAVKKANEVLAKYYPQTKPGYYPYLGMAGGIIIVEAMKRAGKDLTRVTVVSHHSRQEALDGIGEKRIPYPRPS
jgi:hypothetical protein